MTTKRTPSPETLLDDLQAVIDLLQLQYSRIDEAADLVGAATDVVGALKLAATDLIAISADVSRVAKAQAPARPKKTKSDPNSIGAYLQKQATARKRRKALGGD